MGQIITLHYIAAIYSGLFNSNLKVHYGDTARDYCNGIIVEK